MVTPLVGEVWQYSRYTFVLASVIANHQLDSHYYETQASDSHAVSTQLRRAKHTVRASCYYQVQAFDRFIYRQALTANRCRDLS